MASSLQLKTESAPEIKKFSSRRARFKWFPSATASAFVFPIMLLYWQVGGPSGLLADPSTGVHVRTGQWILIDHAIPRRDLFSFTMPNRPWCDWEWLSDVVFALAYRLRGLAGVAGLGVPALCILSVIVYRTARVYAGPVVAGVVCSLVMATTIVHWLTRPHLFTWIGVAGFCWALERRACERKLWVLAVGMAFWVNLHPGFVAGFLILGAWLVGAALNHWLSKTEERRTRYRREMKWCGLALVVCGFATIANPYFLQLHYHVASYLFAPSTVTARVSEWLPPDFHNPRLGWFELLLPLAGAAGVWHGLKRRFHWSLLIFGSMHLALLSVRNVPLCAIPHSVAAPSVSMFLSSIPSGEHFAPAENLEWLDLQALASTRRSIDVCMFSFTDRRLAGALIRDMAFKCGSTGMESNTRKSSNEFLAMTQ
jgi:hypothetical protein